MIELVIHNRQRKIPIVPEIMDNMQVAAKQAFQQLQINAEAEAAVSFVSEQVIYRWNKQERGIAKVTDVLSFPFLDFSMGSAGELSKDLIHPTDIHPESGRIMLGEIMICPQRAQEQAAEYGHGLMREICFLTIHGLLHLLGYDHIEQEEPMFSLQAEILSAAGIDRIGQRD